MFDQWVRGGEYQARTLRMLTPAAPVLVDLWESLPGMGIRPGASSPPLYLRGAGVRLDPVMPGVLHAWCRQTTGTWWALVTIPARSGDGRSQISLRLWVCSDHVRLDTAVAREQAGMNETLTAIWAARRTRP